MALRDDSLHDLEEICVGGYQTHSLNMCCCPDDGVSHMRLVLSLTTIQCGELSIDAVIGAPTTKCSLADSGHPHNKDTGWHLLNLAQFEGTEQRTPPLFIRHLPNLVSLNVRHEILADWKKSFGIFRTTA